MVCRTSPKLLLLPRQAVQDGPQEMRAHVHVHCTLLRVELTPRLAMARRVQHTPPLEVQLTTTQARGKALPTSCCSGGFF